MKKSEKTQISKPSIAFVVQRCGSNVNGGAESLCLQVAERMSNQWDIEILTTCALDYMTWENHFPAGEDVCNGVKVKRFKNAEQRDVDVFNKLSAELHPRIKTCTLEEQELWMRTQGPYSPDLSCYIKENEGNYAGFIFFGYLYASTVQNLPLVSEKAYLVPCAHDEWPIYFSMFDILFSLPRKFAFNMNSEKEFLRKHFFHLNLEGPTAGTGIEIPNKTDPDAFIQKYNITSPYLLYCGRVDPSKGCAELLEAFLKWKYHELLPHKLVLVGKPAMEIPLHEDIITTGFVTEEEKWAAIAGCEWLVMPSKYESLSLSLLEAWGLGKPAIVNKHCDVLVEHCTIGKGGLLYDDWDHALKILTQTTHTQYSELSKNGREYVQKNYDWEKICSKYASLIEY